MSGLHVSGVLVRARPENVETVRERLERLPGLHIEAVTGDGRLIAVSDCESNAALTERFHGIQDTDGVLSASLVYHYSDRNEAPDEEMTA